MRRFIAILMLVSLTVGLVGHEAEARRRRRHRTRSAKIINEKKLYERIGGAKALSDIVDEWVRLNLADAKVAQTLTETAAKPERLAKLRKVLGDQLCELADGPCQAKSSDAKTLHDGLAIGEDEFLVSAQNLFKSMQKFGVPEREKNEMLGRIGELRAELMRETPST